MTSSGGESSGRLVTRTEAEPILGYARGSLKALMTAHPGRWPEPAGKRGMAYVYELEALLAAAGTDRVECLICGRSFRSLGPHLARAHDTDAASYRAEHRLRATEALMGRWTRDRLAAERSDHPELWQAMRATPADPDLMRERSAESRAGTDDLPQVREARRRSAAAASAAKHEHTMRRLRDAGYASLAAALDATRAMSVARAAHHLGVSRSTIQRWRSRSPQTDSGAH